MSYILPYKVIIVLYCYKLMCTFVIRTYLFYLWSHLWLYCCFVKGRDIYWSGHKYLWYSYIWGQLYLWLGHLYYWPGEFWDGWGQPIYITIIIIIVWRSGYLWQVYLYFRSNINQVMFKGQPVLFYLLFGSSV